MEYGRQECRRGFISAWKKEELSVVALCSRALGFSKGHY
jgi:hypothetical protein